jgi:hypothetical protein
MTFTDLGKIFSYLAVALIGVFSVWFVNRYVGETKHLIFSECIKLYQSFSGSENFKQDKESITRMLDDAGTKNSQMNV